MYDNHVIFIYFIIYFYFSKMGGSTLCFFTVLLLAPYLTPLI